MTPAFKRWLRSLDVAERRKRAEFEQACAEEFEVPYAVPLDEAECVRMLTNAVATERFLRSLAEEKP